SFKIERIAFIGNKYAGDTQGIPINKGRRGGIPGSIAPGFKGIPDPSAGKAGSIRLLLNQLPASEFFYGQSISDRFKKSIVLFCCGTSKWLKPMGIMGSSLGDSPFLHSC